MSQHYKPSGNTPPPGAQPVEVHPKERERVAQLIALNKSPQALDFAKDVHKRCRSAASETLLLDAYGARLASLVERKLDREAAALIDLVRERYPSAGERLREWNAVVAAAHGDFSALLEPLNDAALPAEKQAAIAAWVRREVLDLRALADCRTLAPEHSWRTAAGALSQAFEAVTSGPVADEALTLPEVSRSNPLAPWKMLVRAIAAFYRREDALCEKYLAAVEPESAAARLVAPLRALIHKPVAHTPPSLTAAAAALVNQAGGNLDSLRTTLKKLDAALDRKNHPSILLEIRNAVAACRQAQPDVLVRLKQHIAVRAMGAGLSPDKVASAMDGPSLKNAYFWRLLARAHEEAGEPASIVFACSAWEEFRKHAVREGWLPAKGPEAAALYLHMADQLRRLGTDDLHGMRIRFERSFDGHASYYQGQPAEIRALMPSRGDRNLYFLSLDGVLERACAAHPSRENFERWLRDAGEESPAACDRVAERWCAALPHDVPPLLRLMQSAEERNALSKAFKLMERAEQIDGLNPEVRRARLRLLVSMAARHLREKKPKLAEKELCQIEALPQAQQGDRPAFVAALRFVWHLLRNARPEADAAYAEGVRLLADEPTAQFLFLEVERWCGRPTSAMGKPKRPTTPLFAAFGRVCAIGDDMGMPVDLIEGMPEPMMKELSAPKVTADPRSLAALGEVAVRQDYFPLAYAVAGAGLAQGAESRGRFLFLRARSLPPWEEERRASCLAAASELARRQHDSELLKRIGEWRDEALAWLDAPQQAQAAPDTDQIGRVVERELQERTLSKSRPASRFAAADDGECPCPKCAAKRGELPPEMMELMDQLGPEAMAQVLAEMLGMGGKKKRGRQRSTLDGIDFPF